MHRIIDFRFLLTPFAITVFDYNKNIRKYIYIFGIKVIDYPLYKHVLNK